MAQELPLCAVCAPGYRSVPGGKCDACADGLVTSDFVPLIIFCLVIV